jgi:hypothetical protein
VTVRAGHAPRLLGVGLLAVAVVAAALLAALARPAHTPRPVQSRGFPTLTPAPAPVTWRQLTLPDGTAVLSYPPSLQPTTGDNDAVTVARRSPAGAYLLYLNATPARARRIRRTGPPPDCDTCAPRAHPRPGRTPPQAESPSWAEPDPAYSTTTKTGAHHYEELACLVQGRSGASVLVAAAPAGQWTQAASLLERAVAAYQVR